MLAHPLKCELAQKKRYEEQEAWIAEWPNYCGTCNGKAVIVHPADEYTPKDYEHCPSCLGEGKCPRCGKFIGSPENLSGFPSCPHCDWGKNGAYHKGNVCPPDYTCNCEYLGLYQEMYDARDDMFSVYSTLDLGE